MEEKKKYGFILIELLVVIAIIALTFYAVYPIIHPGPCGSKSTICKSNLHGLFISFLLYHQGNEHWPDNESWCDLSKAYSDENGELFLCPFDKIGPCSYALNESIPADAVELPGDLVLLFESAPGWNQVGGPDDVVTDRHGKKNHGANIAFADSHVEFIEAEDIPILRWTLDK